MRTTGTGATGRSAAPRGQGGFSLLEVVLCLVVISVAILSIAAALLASARIDNQTNLQQRSNLALTTFAENLSYSPPASVGCTAVSSPPANSGTLATAPSSHAKTLLENTIDDNVEVQGWVDRGMVYTITEIGYGKWTAGGYDEDFSAACNVAPPTSPDPLKPVPYYPVISVSLEVCFGGSPTATACAVDTPTVSTQIIERGGRTG